MPDTDRRYSNKTKKQQKKRKKKHIGHQNTHNLSLNSLPRKLIKIKKS